MFGTKSPQFQKLKRRSIMLGVALAMFSTGSAAAAPAPVPKPIEIQPHRAVYNIKMVSAKSGSQLLGIQGKLLYSLEKSCSGWISNHHFKLVYDYSENPSVEIETKFTSVESLDGKDMEFSSARYSNGELEQALRGNAHLGDAASGGKAVYQTPEDLEYALKPETIFPVKHTQKLLEAAQANQKIMSAYVFDGSDELGASELNAVIGKKQPVNNIETAGMATSTIDTNLLTGDAWHVDMASFRDKDPENNAEYELMMTVLQNGIVKDMRVNYHDFSIVQNMTALETIKTEECGVPENE